jgi:tryptophan halogenase
VGAIGVHRADRVHRIIVVGGGAAGWLAAAALARLLKPSFCDIRLIDSPPGEAHSLSEAVLPSFHRLNKLLCINEDDLVKKTRGTFKLGTQFIGWGSAAVPYLHSFGTVGAKLDAVSFHHYWIKLRLLGDATRFDSYSTAAVAAAQGRFAPPVQDRRSMLSLYSYGYHFHAALLCAYLKEYALAHGVTRVRQSIADVELRSEDGFVAALKMDDGSRICADLYIDCSGAAGMLSRHAMFGGYEDWSHWMPCDRIVSLACASGDPPAPYSQSTAERSGWRRSVPLQHCLDSSFVYSSRHVGDDEAAATLLAGLPGPALAKPSLQRLRPGRPARFWNKNCVALNGDGLDPLESTALHLVQTGITRLVTLFPVTRFSPLDVEEYNRLTTLEYERIRDFLVLHYQSAQCADSPFWEDCRHMKIPETLRAKIELFTRSGRIAMLEDEHFGEDSWLSLFAGRNITPQGYDPLADVLDIGEVKTALLRMRSMIDEAVATLPTHGQYIRQHCAAGFGSDI